MSSSQADTLSSPPSAPPPDAALTDPYCVAYPRLHAHSPSRPPPPRGKQSFPLYLPFQSDASLAPSVPNVYARLDAFFNGDVAVTGGRVEVGADNFTLAPPIQPHHAPLGAHSSSSPSNTVHPSPASPDHGVSSVSRALRHYVSRAATAASLLLLRADGALMCGGDFVRGCAELRGSSPATPEEQLHRERAAGDAKAGGTGPAVLDWDTGALRHEQEHSMATLESKETTSPSDWLGCGPPPPPLRAPSQPLLTVSNHSSTLDEPIFTCALSPASVGDDTRMRWTACAQDICFESSPAAAFFYLGRALPLQRGAGLLQPALARVGNVLGQGEWIHIFPEGRVVFEPIYRMSDSEGGAANSDRRGHETSDRGHDTGAGRGPALLAPPRWGVGKLAVDAALPWALRQVDAELALHSHSEAPSQAAAEQLPALPPVIVPFCHDSATAFMPGSSTIPVPRSLRRLLSLPSALPSPAPPPTTIRDGPPVPYLDCVRGYAHHLRAWQQGRIPFSPRIESAYSEVTTRLHAAVGELLGRGPGVPASPKAGAGTEVPRAAGGLLRGMDADPFAAETAAGAPGEWARGQGLRSVTNPWLTGLDSAHGAQPDPYIGVPLGYPYMAVYERARRHIQGTAETSNLVEGGSPWRQPGWFVPTTSSGVGTLQSAEALLRAHMEATK